MDKIPEESKNNAVCSVTKREYGEYKDRIVVKITYKRYETNEENKERIRVETESKIRREQLQVEWEERELAFKNAPKPSVSDSHDLATELGLTSLEGDIRICGAEFLITLFTTKKRPPMIKFRGFPITYRRVKYSHGW